MEMALGEGGEGGEGGERGEGGKFDTGVGVGRGKHLGEGRV